MTTVDGVAIDLCPERHQQHAVQARHLARVGVPVDADDDGVMPGARLCAVGAEQAVPPGQVETEVGIGLVVLDRVVHAVHVGRDDKKAHNPVE